MTDCRGFVLHTWTRARHNTTRHVSRHHIFAVPYQSYDEHNDGDLLQRDQVLSGLHWAHTEQTVLLVDYAVRVSVARSRTLYGQGEPQVLHSKVYCLDRGSDLMKHVAEAWSLPTRFTDRESEWNSDFPNSKFHTWKMFQSSIEPHIPFPMTIHRFSNASMYSLKAQEGTEFIYVENKVCPYRTGALAEQLQRTRCLVSCTQRTRYPATAGC